MPTTMAPTTVVLTTVASTVANNSDVPTTMALTNK